LGYSAGETAKVIGSSAGNVRLLHLRARKAIKEYDESRSIPSPQAQERHRAALQQFLDCLLRQDARGLEVLLAESVRTVTDSAGKYTALATPLDGRARVVRLYLAAARQRPAASTQIEMLLINGFPAAVVQLERPVRRQAPRTLLRCELDDRGQIRLIHAILAPRKLAALRWM
jgi:RNA polymerase sigma-70 factor (ECF subfamily)